jgi:hypothetical protein
MRERRVDGAAALREVSYAEIVNGHARRTFVARPRWPMMCSWKPDMTRSSRPRS